jgi:O-antigen/teichoic acid export membrane protein
MNENRSRMRTAVASATTGIITYVGLTTLALAASSPLWVALIYGPAWRDMSPIVLVTAPALGIGTAFTFVIAALNAIGRARSVMTISVIFTALYWTSAVVLVPLFGPLGLPIAYSVAAVSFVSYIQLFGKFFGPLEIVGSLRLFTVASLLLPIIAWLYVSQSHPAFTAVCTATIVVLLIRSVVSGGAGELLRAPISNSRG